MILIRTFKIAQHERGLLFKDRNFVRVLEPGTYRFIDPMRKLQVDVLDVRTTMLQHPALEVIAKSGALAPYAMVIDLKDTQRGLLREDGRLTRMLGPGLHVAFTVLKQVTVEVLDATNPRLVHPELPRLLELAGTAAFLNVQEVQPGQVGLYFRNGTFVETLAPGMHAFVKNGERVQVKIADLRLQALDVSGQEIMTADRVTLRLNAMVTYRVVDPLRTVLAATDATQALYREAQLALRGAVGTRDLDALLANKESLGAELLEVLRPKATDLGLEVQSAGIRDLILPGEMKEILNRVITAKKSAEAALITRREETAEIRSQANTAKLFEGNPMLLRLRELEVLEKVAEKANLNVILGESGLSERVLKLV